jgi:hypothetical protein
MSQPAQPAPAGLKYSDYAQVTTIISSAIATGSAFGVITGGHPEVTGIFAGIAFLSGLIGQWLQSKGD